MGDIPDVGELLFAKVWYRVPQLKCKISLSTINDLQISLDNIGQNLLKNIPNTRYLIIRNLYVKKIKLVGHI